MVEFPLPRRRRPRARRPVSVRPLLLGGLVVLLLGGLAGWLLTGSGRPATLWVDGRLMLEAEVTEVTVPARTRVDEVLVSEGMTVETGQPLAVLSWDAAREDQRALARQAAGMVARLRCLKKGLARTADESPVPDPDPETHVGAQDCELTRVRHGASLTQIWDEMEALQERLVLLDRFWHVARRRLDRPDGALDPVRSQDLEQVLKIALARNLTRSEIARTKARMRSLHLEIRENHLADLAETSTALEDVLSRIAALEDQPDETTLTAVRAGIVQNVRAGLVGKIPPDGAAIMRIVSGQETMVIHANIGLDRFDGLSEGDAAAVRIAAMPPDTPSFAGTVLRTFIVPAVSEDASALYLAEISLMPGELDRIRERVVLTPGAWSQVEVGIDAAPPFALSSLGAMVCGVVPGAFGCAESLPAPGGTESGEEPVGGF